jgi:polyhydroxyalkanoate synthesis regulator phasin
VKIFCQTCKQRKEVPIKVNVGQEQVCLGCLAEFKVSLMPMPDMTERTSTEEINREIERLKNRIAELENKQGRGGNVVCY